MSRGIESLTTKDRATELANIGRREAHYVAPDWSSCPIRNPELRGEPVAIVAHVSRDMAKFGYTADRAGTRTQDPIQALQPTSREANVKRATVIKSCCDEGMDEAAEAV